MKNKLLTVLAIFVLSGVIVTGSTHATIQPVFASSESGEGGAGSEGSDESETSGTQELSDEGGDNNQNDDDTSAEQQQQETGLDNDELGESTLTSPAPCPNSVEVDSIPEGCFPPTDETTTTSDVPDTVPTTQPSNQHAQSRPPN